MSHVFFIQLSGCCHECNNRVFIVFVHIDVTQHWAKSRKAVPGEFEENPPIGYLPVPLLN